MRTLILALTTMFLLSSNLSAHEYQAGTLNLHHPYAYAVQKIGKMSWAFLTINNNGTEDDRLIGASSPIAGSIDIMDGDTKLEKVDIGAGKSVRFKNDGIHLVLNDIKKTPIKTGARKPITLKFEHAGEVKAELLFVPVAEISLCDDASHNKKIKPVDAR